MKMTTIIRDDAISRLFAFYSRHGERRAGMSTSHHGNKLVVTREYNDGIRY